MRNLKILFKKKVYLASYARYPPFSENRATTKSLLNLFLADRVLSAAFVSAVVGVLNEVEELVRLD